MQEERSSESNRYTVSTVNFYEQRRPSTTRLVKRLP